MPASLAPVVRAALGRGLDSAERLTTTTKKGVYRLSLTGGGTAMAYVWAPAENYWPASPDPQDAFTDASGLSLFEAAHAALTSCGVRVPRLFWASPAGSVHPADVAVVEDVRGGTLEDRPVPPALREMLAAMAAVVSPRIGKIDQPDGTGRSCPQIVLDIALRDLASALPSEPRLAGLDDVLRAAMSAIEPRSTHALVHGELGPDHVLLDDEGAPVLVDIEGLTWFDVEWEHAFLEMRFPDYAALRLPDLDPARLHFYRLARHLSLVAGPLRLLTTDYPGRAFMQDIADHHTGRALTYLP